MVEVLGHLAAAPPEQPIGPARDVRRCHHDVAELVERVYIYGGTKIEWKVYSDKCLLEIGVSVNCLFNIYYK